jgi:hypothetical protein
MLARRPYPVLKEPLQLDEFEARSGLGIELVADVAETVVAFGIGCREAVAIEDHALFAPPVFIELRNPEGEFVIHGFYIKYEYRSVE